MPKEKRIHKSYNVSLITIAIPTNIYPEIQTSLKVSPLLALCSQWSFERVFIEIFLTIVLLENMASFYIIVTSGGEKKTRFLSNYLATINIFNLLTVLLLLFYPFVFSWNHLLTNNDDVNYLNHEIFRDTASENFGESSADNHPCQQKGKLKCQLSGFLFGIFLFIPLSLLAVMNIDVAFRAFWWKIYHFQPHTTSAVCLTLMAGFSFAIVTSFGLPALGVGTHFYYSTFLKICWLSVSVEDYAVQEFAYFIFGFGCVLLLLIFGSSFFVLRAYYAQLSLVDRLIRLQSTTFFAQHYVFKSKSWLLQAVLILWMNTVAFISYLPLTVGYLVRYHFIADLDWFDLIIEASVFLLPVINPVLIIKLNQSYWKRAGEIHQKCTGESKLNSRKIHSSSSSQFALSSRSSISSARSLSTDSFDSTFYEREFCNNDAIFRENFQAQRSFPHRGFGKFYKVYPGKSDYPKGSHPSSCYLSDNKNFGKTKSPFIQALTKQDTLKTNFDLIKDFKRRFPTNQQSKFLFYYAPPNLSNSRHKKPHQFQSNYKKTPITQWCRDSTPHRTASSAHSSTWKLSKSFYFDPLRSKKISCFQDQPHRMNAQFVKSGAIKRFPSNKVNVSTCKEPDRFNCAVMSTSSDDIVTSSIPTTTARSCDDPEENFIRNFSYRYKAFSKQ